MKKLVSNKTKIWKFKKNVSMNININLDHMATSLINIFMMNNIFNKLDHKKMHHTFLNDIKNCINWES